jgi:hypothetical protein
MWGINWRSHGKIFDSGGVRSGQIGFQPTGSIGDLAEVEQTPADGSRRTSRPGQVEPREQEHPDHIDRGQESDAYGDAQGDGDETRAT